MATGPAEKEPGTEVRRHELTDADRRVVAEIVEEHVLVSCDLVVIDEHTWAIHGSIAVDGDVLVAEFEDPDEAESALEEIAAAEREESEPN